MNYFGWIDFSRRDRDLARDIIASLNEPGAVDELGIGVIRDGFADYFFPGTSTIQTIAKYFFLVSYQLEKLTRAPHQNTEQELRKMERECSFAMWKSLPKEERRNSGIFGRTFFERGSKDWVKRTPSSVYWTGIRKLGFWKSENSDLSLPDFLRVAQNQEPIPVESDEDLKNRKRNAAGFEKNWHWNLPPVEARGNWQKVPSIKLTLGEAQFFLEQIKKEQPDSMFAFLSSYHKLPDSFSGLERLALPKNLKFPWAIANAFSEFIQPAQIQFNVLLGNDSAEQDWKLYPAKRLKGLANSIDLQEIFKFLRIKNGSLEIFLRKLQEIYKKDNNIQALQKLLITREKELKGEKRAKIGKEKSDPEENWKGARILQYRYPNARKLLNNAANAEKVQ